MGAVSCECVSCDWCGGTGFVWQTVGGQLVRHRIDDMGDLHECPECDGAGVIETCPECAEAREAEYE